MKLRYTFIFFFFIILSIKAQDPIFSQFYAAPIQVNPAFAGNTNAPLIAMNYRNQWPNLNQAYVTYSLSYDQYFKNINSGFGLLILADDSGRGLYKTTKVGATYAYKFRLAGNTYIKGAIEASGIQNRIGWDQLIFLDQINPETGPISPGGTPYPTEETPPENLSKTYFDASAGMLVYNEHFYGGISAKHLNTPNLNFTDINNNLSDGLPIRLTLHGGAEFGLGKRKSSLFISPNILLVKQADFYQVNAGAYIGLNTFYTGLWFRHTFKNPDAVIMSFGFKRGILKFGYSYDLTVSSLGLSTGGSHEVGIIINLENTGRFKESKYNDCFNLFR